MSDQRRHYEIDTAALCRLLRLEGQPKLMWCDDRTLHIVIDDPTAPVLAPEPTRIGECESCHQQRPLFSVCPDCIPQPAF